MARTTGAAVVAILDNPIISASQIEAAYLDDANIFVTDNLGSSDLTTDTLTSIEKWVCAHMIVTTRERMSKKEEAGGAKIEYQGKYEEGLMSTPYGQMAIALDSTGTLAELSKGKLTIDLQAL